MKNLFHESFFASMLLGVLAVAMALNALGNQEQGETPATSTAAVDPTLPEVGALDGDTLYKQNCLRCHMKPELKFLGLLEYSDEQLNTIVRHMQVRANLPQEEAKAILEYLTQ
jgi:mono/diheme cytochrome c family protein